MALFTGELQGNVYNYSEEATKVLDMDSLEEDASLLYVQKERRILWWRMNENTSTGRLLPAIAVPSSEQRKRTTVPYLHCLSMDGLVAHLHHSRTVYPYDTARHDATRHTHSSPPLTSDNKVQYSKWALANTKKGNNSPADPKASS
jgi:hypothetical protein